MNENVHMIRRVMWRDDVGGCTAMAMAKDFESIPQVAALQAESIINGIMPCCEPHYLNELLMEWHHIAYFFADRLYPSL